MPLFRRGRSAEARSAASGLPPLSEGQQQQGGLGDSDEMDDAALLGEMREELARLAAENRRMRDDTKKYLKDTEQREADRTLLCACVCVCV